MRSVFHEAYNRAHLGKHPVRFIDTHFSASPYERNVCAPTALVKV